VDVARFFARVALTSFTPFVLAALIRKLAGLPRLQRWDGELAGMNVLLLVVFAIAIMAGVTETFLAQPDYMLGMLAWAWFAAVFWHVIGYVLFVRHGIEVALNAAILFGNRNMGLTLVVTAGTAGEAFQMYAGLAQIPMYCAPLLLSPLTRRIRNRQPD
jgi:BASS family bile acid:Na+ symporter